MREIHLQRKRKDNHQNALSKIVLQHCEAQGEKNHSAQQWNGIGNCHQLGMEYGSYHRLEVLGRWQPTDSVYPSDGHGHLRVLQKDSTVGFLIFAWTSLVWSTLRRISTLGTRGRQGRGLHILQL